MSELRANTISDAAGTGPVALTDQWAVRQFWLFNGDTNTVLNSGNTSSVTDNSTGQYTFNFTNSFAALDYASTGAGNSGDDGTSRTGAVQTPPDTQALTTSTRVIHQVISSGSATDVVSSSALIGDLA